MSEQLDTLRVAAIAAGWQLREGERTGVHVAERGGAKKYASSLGSLRRDVTAASSTAAGGLERSTGAGVRGRRGDAGGR